MAEDPCQLDINHRDGNHLNNARENLQTLCANCHRLITKRMWATGSLTRRDGLHLRKTHRLPQPPLVIPPGTPIGEEVAITRAWMGLSQGTVARRAGLTQSRVSELEQGRLTGSPEFRLNTTLKIQEAIRVLLAEHEAVQGAPGRGWGHPPRV